MLAEKILESDDSNLDASSNGRSKRRRVKPSRFDFNFLDNEEQRYLQQVALILTVKLLVHFNKIPTFFTGTKNFKNG